MNWRRISVWSCSVVILMGTLMIIGIGGVHLASKTVHSSNQLPGPTIEPRKPARGFISMPSVDTVSVQNVYSMPLQVEISFVDPIDEIIKIVTVTAAAASGRILAKPIDFNGFAKISAELPLQAVNFALDESGNEAYLGVNVDEIFGRKDSGEPWVVPFMVPIALLMKDTDGWNTKFSIQNLGNSAAVAAIVYYHSVGSIADPLVITIPQNGSFAVDLAESHLPSGFIGSAVISSNQPILVASSVQFYNETLGIRSAYPVKPFPSMPPLLAPVLFKHADLQTSKLCVQNVAQFAQTIIVDYSDSIAATQTIPAYSTYCFDQENEAHVDGWVGSAVIASNPPGFLSAVVVVDAVDQDKVVGRWSYAVDEKGSINAQVAVAFPLLYNDHKDWTTAIYVTNFGEQNAVVSPHYTAQSGFVPCAEPFTLAAGETRTILQTDLPAQFDIGTAYFTSTHPVAAVVSATSHRVLGETDRHFGYNSAYLYRPGTPPEACSEGSKPTFIPLDQQYWSYQRHYYMEIGAPEMWMRGVSGINPFNPITVAVIDTGVDLEHPDLVDNLLPGYDFVDEDTLPQDTSADSHGTKVAGIIAARMNNDFVEGKARGVVGIGGGNALLNTPGLRIMPLRVAAESTSVDCALSARAIDYAVDHGARVINISYGSKEVCPDELAAIQRAYAAGLVIVAGAGNDNSAEPFYPAAYGTGENEDLVLAVGGLDAGGVKAYQSNYGNWIDFAAPYDNLRSLTKDGGYASDSGTSYSAPLVSGLLGILMSNYGWDRDEAINVLRDTADNVDLANEVQFKGLLGVGRINADKASKSNLVYMFIPLVTSGTE
jgi:thermitase